MMYRLAGFLVVLALAGCVDEQQFSPIPYEWVDQNQDGYIVFDEYYYYMSRTEATPPFDLGQTWANADDNRDGVIGRHERWSNLFPTNVVYRQRSY